MNIEHVVSVKVVKDLLSNAMSDRKYIDRHMINNVSICAGKKKLELDDAKIEIDPKHVDTSFISTYRDVSDNYTEGKYLIIILFYLFSYALQWHADTECLICIMLI